MPRPERANLAVRRGSICLVLILLALCSPVPTAAAGGGADDADATEPAARHTRLDRPLGRAPTYLTAAAGIGGLFAHAHGQPGYAFGLLMRPARAADLMPSLFAGNTGLALQVDVQHGGPDRRILSGDLVFRRYLSDMRALRGGHAAFLGLGLGLSETTAPLPEGGSSGSRGFSVLGEAGVELTIKRSLVLFLAGQYRHYRRDGHDFSGWTCHLGIGLPLAM